MNLNSQSQFDPFRISIPFLPSHSPDKKIAFSPALPSSLQPNSEENTSSPYFVTALNTASLLGYVPFKVRKIKKDQNDRNCEFEYKIIPVSFLRKIICALIHLTTTGVSLYNNVIQMIFTNSSEFSSNFTRTFDMVASVGMFFLSSSFIYTCWRRQDQLLEIVRDTSVNYDKRSERKHRLITIFLLLVSHVVSLYILFTYDPFSKTTGMKSLWPSTTDGMTTLDYAIRIGLLLCAIFLYHSSSFDYFSTVFMVVLVLSMRGVKKTFCDRMSSSLERMDLDSGFEHYIGLKQLSSNITRTFGTMILFYYIISVAYFAKIPESSVWKQNVRIVGMLSYFSFGSVVWLVSAEFHMNVRDVVQNWATQMQDLDDLSIDTRIRLLNVVNDNLLDPIGISCKFFTITYGFLGSMLGLIVTYAIIVFQMQAKPNPTASVGGQTTPSPDLTTLSIRNTEL